MCEITQLFTLLFNLFSRITLWLSLCFCKVGIIIIPIPMQISGNNACQCLAQHLAQNQRSATHSAIVLHTVGLIIMCLLIKYLVKVSYV